MSEPQRPPEHHSVSHNRRIGLWLFLIYFLVYAGFVALVARDYKSMGTVVFSGLNLGIVYGFGLIVGAFVLAVVYLFFAKGDEAK